MEQAWSGHLLLKVVGVAASVDVAAVVWAAGSNSCCWSAIASWISELLWKKKLWAHYWIVKTRQTSTIFNLPKICSIFIPYILVNKICKSHKPQNFMPLVQNSHWRKHLVCVCKCVCSCISMLWICILMIQFTEEIIQLLFLFFPFLFDKTVLEQV